MDFSGFAHPFIELNPKIMVHISSQLYNSSWMDVIFKNRNKAYGAYRLRAESSANTTKAFFIAAPLFVALFVGPSVYKRFNPEVVIQEVNVSTVDLIAPLEPIKLPVKKQEAPMANPVPDKVRSVKFTANIQVVDQPADENPPLITDLQDAVAGQINQAGIAAPSVVIPVVSTGAGDGIGVADNQVYEASGVDQFPEFEGGMAAWAKFIQRNLRYPPRAEEEGVSGKVFLSFVIERDGSVTDVTLLKGIGAGCDEEAMRVIKKSPKWKPGKQQNNPVRVRYTMPLSFTIN
jgi:protein TonB